MASIANFLTMANIRKKSKDNNEIVSLPNSNPQNKFKEGRIITANELNNIMKNPVERIKPRTGNTLHDEGTNVDYNEERL